MSPTMRWWFVGGSELLLAGCREPAGPTPLNTWSPGGSRIAFAATQAEVADLYVMGASGSGAVRLTQDVGFVGSPAWSPDGTNITLPGSGPAGPRTVPSSRSRKRWRIAAGAGITAGLPRAAVQTPHALAERTAATRTTPSLWRTRVVPTSVSSPPATSRRGGHIHEDQHA